MNCLATLLATRYAVSDVSQTHNLCPGVIVCSVIFYRTKNVTFWEFTKVVSCMTPPGPSSVNPRFTQLLKGQVGVTFDSTVKDLQQTGECHI
ncbi:hypothetical protein V9T40_013660 [Parthenolecanium corni]|uniref:Uncharacterized protein n=1 Tax=Parthenolecanium corni TaxID=536013 RepID=A0AAN9TPG0_9HEMI